MVLIYWEAPVGLVTHVLLVGSPVWIDLWLQTYFADMAPISPTSLDGVFSLLLINDLAQVAPYYIFSTVRHLILDGVHLIQLTPQILLKAGFVIEVVLELVGNDSPIVHQPPIECLPNLIPLNLVLFQSSRLGYADVLSPHALSNEANLPADVALPLGLDAGQMDIEDGPVVHRNVYVLAHHIQLQDLSGQLEYNPEGYFACLQTDLDDLYESGVIDGEELPLLLEYL